MVKSYLNDVFYTEMDNQQPSPKDKSYPRMQFRDSTVVGR